MSTAAGALRHQDITLDEIQAARRRLEGRVVRTPLLKLQLPDRPVEIHLKLESLQPIGAFKIRGAANAMLQLTPEELRRGVWTASAGNMGQGVAWCARELGVPCTVFVPDDGSQTKIDAMEALGATVVRVTRDDFYETFARRAREGMDGAFIHPFSDRNVMAGNATIGLEILEDLPDVEAVLVAYGGGGLSCGIASAFRAMGSAAKVLAVEPDTAAPLTASFQAGALTAAGYRRTFVDGAGAARLYPEMWDLAGRVLDGAIAVPVRDVADAVKLLVQRAHLVVEGAGALSAAAALGGQVEARRVCCVISGGNIDLPVLISILQGTFDPLGA